MAFTGLAWLLEDQTWEESEHFLYLGGKLSYCCRLGMKFGLASILALSGPLPELVEGCLFILGLFSVFINRES